MQSVHVEAEAVLLAGVERQQLGPVRGDPVERHRRRLAPEHHRGPATGRSRGGAVGSVSVIRHPPPARARSPPCSRASCTPHRDVRRRRGSARCAGRSAACTSATPRSARRRRRRRCPGSARSHRSTGRRCRSASSSPSSSTEHRDRHAVDQGGDATVGHEPLDGQTRAQSLRADVGRDRLGRRGDHGHRLAPIARACVWPRTSDVGDRRIGLVGVHERRRSGRAARGRRASPSTRSGRRRRGGPCRPRARRRGRARRRARRGARSRCRRAACAARSRCARAARRCARTT